MKLYDWVDQQVDGRTVVRVSEGRITSTINRVHTMRGVQTHRGHKGLVYVTFEGQKRPETFYCCFHQKAKSAREHADMMSRAFRRLIAKEN